MNTKQYEAEFALKNCTVCGIVIKDHPCCAICGILSGPQHIEIELHQLRNGKLACASCREARDGISAEI